MSLDVYLHGDRIGTLFPAGENDYRLAYSPELAEQVGPGTALLSNALPVRAEPYSAESTRAYVEGLLPEGMQRARIGRELGLDASDGYLLLERLGRDCPGAVVFLPKGERIETPDAGAVAWLTEVELEELVSPPPERLYDPDVERRMRFVLGGNRHKLSLLREGPEGRWAWPEAGLPSTHIVKPESGEYPELVANEMYCTTVLRQVGLPVPGATVERIAGRPCLVTERFDRVGEGLGAKRLHQETFCQALGIGPGEEEEDGEEIDAPGFGEASGLLHAIERGEEATTVIEAGFCNYILGNGDAHGRNFALLFREGRFVLAPFYDITSTVVYDEPLHVGMVIPDEYDQTAYLLELGHICEECALDFEFFRDLAASTAAKVGEALETVAQRSRDEGWYAPVIDEIFDLAKDRALGLGYEVEY